MLALQASVRWANADDQRCGPLLSVHRVCVKDPDARRNPHTDAGAPSTGLSDSEGNRIRIMVSTIHDMAAAKRVFACALKTRATRLQPMYAPPQGQRP